MNKEDQLRLLQIAQAAFELGQATERLCQEMKYMGGNLEMANDDNWNDALSILYQKYEELRRLKIAPLAIYPILDEILDDAHSAWGDVDWAESGDTWGETGEGLSFDRPMTFDQLSAKYPPLK